MKIVLQIPIEQTASLVEMIPGIQEEDVGGLYINIRFEKGKQYYNRYCYENFNLDKHIEENGIPKLKSFSDKKKYHLKKNKFNNIYERRIY